LAGVTTTQQDEIWNEIPNLITPLQDRVRQLASALGGKRKVLAAVRIESALYDFQRLAGDHYWNAMEGREPLWLEQRFETLNEALNVAEFQ
jgi:hypothetical protein